MTRLIRSDLFFYLFSLLFTGGSIYVGGTLHYQIALWGVYVVFVLYLYLLENIRPPLAAFLPVVVFITGGVASPLMPLLFILLPLELWYRENRLQPYLLYAVFSVLVLLITGDFENYRHFSLYLVFVLSAVLTYLFLHDYISRLFDEAPWEPKHRPSRKELEEDPAGHPLSVIQRYMRFYRHLDDTTTVTLRLVHVENCDTGHIDIGDTDLRETDTGHSFTPRTIELKGFLHRCATHIDDIHILRKKDHLSETERHSLPMTDTAAVRAYLPIKLFSSDKTDDRRADYIITADCPIHPASIAGADALESFREKLGAVQRNVTYLLRVVSSYDEIKNGIRVHKRISSATADILESFSRRKLFRTVAASLFNIFDLSDDRSVISVLISEYNNNRHVYHLFILHRTGSYGVRVDEVQEEVSFDVPPGSVHEMMLKKKLPGKYWEIPPPEKAYPVFTDDRETDRRKLTDSVVMYSYLIKNRFHLEDEKQRISLRKHMPKSREKAFDWAQQSDSIAAWELYLEQHPRRSEEDTVDTERDALEQINSNADYATNRIADILLTQKQTPEKGTLSVFFNNYNPAYHNSGEEKNGMRGISERDDQILDLVSRVFSSALENIEMFEEKMEDSNIDGMTQLYNRRYLQQKLPEEFQKAVRNRDPLSVIMLDIDKFKNINDTYGHKVGDVVIVTLAKIIINNTRNVDMAVRYGGEEFIILLHSADITSARNIAEMLRKKIAGVLVTIDDEKKKKIGFTSSFGVSSYTPPDGSDTDTPLVDNPDDLVKTADTALYHSKRTGRNKVTVYTPDVETARENGGEEPHNDTANDT